MRSEKTVQPLQPNVVLKLEGNKRINEHYFNAIMGDLLTSSSTMTSSQFLEKMKFVQRELDSSGLFEKRSIKIETNPNGQIVVDIKVEEKGVFFAKAEGSVNGRLDTEVQGSIELGLRSPFGYGERLNFESGVNNHGAPTNSVSCFYPHFFFDRSLKLSYGRSREIRTHLQSLTASQHHVTLNLHPKSGTHPTISTGVVLTDEIPLVATDGSAKRVASSGVLSATSAASKVFLQSTHTFYDSREPLEPWNPSSPMLGTHLAGSVDLALPGGATQYAKAVAMASSAWSVGGVLAALVPKRRTYWDDVIISFSGTVGMIRPNWALDWAMGKTGVSSRPPQHVDRFYLGGPSSIRGFETMGIGPRSKLPRHSGNGTTLHLGSDFGSSSCNGNDLLPASRMPGTLGSMKSRSPEESLYFRGDSLGGIGKLAGVLRVSFPFPPIDLPKEWDFFKNVRLDCALYCGWIESPYNWQATNGKSYQELLKSISREGRASFSAGVGMPIPSLGSELSLNYSLPLKAASDDVRREWQLSVGIQFGSS